MSDELFEDYVGVVSGQVEIPSWMIALLPPGAPEPKVREVVDCLTDLDVDVAGLSLVEETFREDALWQAGMESTTEVTPGLVQVWAEPTEKLQRYHLEWFRLTPGDVEAVEASRWSIGIALTFGEDPLAAFHRQLKLLAAVAPECAVFVDVAACWPRPGAWLQDSARAKVPPAPKNLYCIHSVYDEERPESGCWLHTHGLLRCNTIELELLDVPRDDADTLCNLIMTAAAMFLDRNIAPPDEPFPVGRDMLLLWLPWQLVIGDALTGELGGVADRDDNHSHPSGILVAPKKKFLWLFGSPYQSPACYLPILSDNPLFYISSAETERMRLLASERVSKFLGLQARYSGRDDWVFLVKLGYPIDGAESDEDHEHLWFLVHSAESYTVDATLTNEPYGLASMHEGDRGRHSLEWLSNWTIMCEHGRFDPDTVVHLERMLAE